VRHWHVHGEAAGRRCGRRVRRGRSTATSAADGTYAIAVQRGDYTVTPSLEARPSRPGSQKVTVSTANVTGVDFKTVPSHGAALAGLGGGRPAVRAADEDRLGDARTDDEDGVEAVKPLRALDCRRRRG